MFFEISSSFAHNVLVGHGPADIERDYPSLLPLIARMAKESRLALLDGKAQMFLTDGEVTDLLHYSREYDMDIEWLRFPLVWDYAVADSYPQVTRSVVAYLVAQGYVGGPANYSLAVKTARQVAYMMLKFRVREYASVFDNGLSDREKMAIDAEIKRGRVEPTEFAGKVGEWLALTGPAEHGPYAEQYSLVDLETA